eukprot:scaffold80925_cov66-Phaeocystis_antarctica.AAC.2
MAGARRGARRRRRRATRAEDHDLPLRAPRHEAAAVARGVGAHAARHEADLRSGSESGLGLGLGAPARSSCCSEPSLKTRIEPAAVAITSRVAESQSWSTALSP